MQYRQCLIKASMQGVRVVAGIRHMVGWRARSVHSSCLECSIKTVYGSLGVPGAAALRDAARAAHLVQAAGEQLLLG